MIDKSNGKYGLDVEWDQVEFQWRLVSIRR